MFIRVCFILFQALSIDLFSSTHYNFEPWLCRIQARGCLFVCAVLHSTPLPLFISQVHYSYLSCFFQFGSRYYTLAVLFLPVLLFSVWLMLLQALSIDILLTIQEHVFIVSTVPCIPARFFIFSILFWAVCIIL